MVSVSCDLCGRTKSSADKKQPEEWILGYDLQVESEAGLQRRVRFPDHWDDGGFLSSGHSSLFQEM